MRVHVQSSRVYQIPLRVMPHSMWSVCSAAWRLWEIFVFTPNGIFLLYIFYKKICFFVNHFIHTTHTS